LLDATCYQSSKLPEALQTPLSEIRINTQGNARDDAHGDAPEIPRA